MASLLTLSEAELQRWPGMAFVLPSGHTQQAKPVAALAEVAGPARRDHSRAWGLALKNLEG